MMQKSAQMMALLRLKRDTAQRGSAGRYESKLGAAKRARLAGGEHDGVPEQPERYLRSIR